MATSDFLPFAVGAGANVLTQAEYEAETTLLANGFQSGVARSEQFNKAFRQCSIMASVLAKFIADVSGQNSVDDGTISTLVANLEAAVSSLSSVADATTTTKGKVQLATSAEVQAGTDATKAVTPSTLSSVLPEFLLTPSALSVSAVQTIAHGKTGVPNIQSVQLVVTTAVAGWSVGDVIGRWIDGYSGVTDTSICVGADGTNIIVTTGSTQVAVGHKTTGVVTSVAVTNFKVEVGIS